MKIIRNNINKPGRVKMLKKKLVDKIHEIQNKDLKKMEGLEVTDRLFAFLHGRLSALSDITKEIILGEED